MQLHAGSWTCRFLVKAQPPDLTCEDVRAALCNAPWQHLGSGGQGSVYGCELGGARVAVKHLQGDSVASLDVELTALARLRHDNLVRMLGYVRRPRPPPAAPRLQHLHNPRARAPPVALLKLHRRPSATARHSSCTSAWSAAWRLPLNPG